ncbi:uncharacterized protein [Panulirus ornatus]|uniref:uncharacterized protein n=1 Tax=Panulirus ornatus TaxID=150431 RepID=UPI003A8583DD
MQVQLAPTDSSISHYYDRESEEMGLQWVLWMMIFTCSTSWRAQVKTTGSSLTNWTYHHDFSPFTQEMMKTYLPSASFIMHGEQQGTPPTSADDHFIMIEALENQLEDLASANTRVVNAVPRENEEHENSLKILKLQNTRKVSKLSVEVSLSQMLVTVAKAELLECDLVLAYGVGYRGMSHVVLKDLLLLQNPRQVVYVNTTEDLTRIIWTSSMCRGYFFLLDDPEPLFDYAKMYEETWDYNGRFVLVGTSLLHLEAFTKSSVGKRTEHIVGAVKSGTEGEWMLYMNQLYWGPGVRRINTWYQHRFTRQLDLFPDKLSDFQGAVLKVSMFNYEPCNFLRRAENGTVIHRYGMDMEVLTAAARILNMTLEFTETPNGIAKPIILSV